MNRVGVFLADGLEEVEGLTVVDILRRADIETIMISVSDHLQVIGTHGIRILADQKFTEIDFSLLDALVLPGGGPGTEVLKNHNGVNEQIKNFQKKEKLVAAICAAPSVLGQALLLQGKKAACYPGFEDQLIGATVLTDKVVWDGTIITSRGMGTAIPFALTLIEYFLGKAAAIKIKTSIIYGHESAKIKKE